MAILRRKKVEIKRSCLDCKHSDWGKENGFCYASDDSDLKPLWFQTEHKRRLIFSGEHYTDCPAWEKDDDY